MEIKQHFVVLFMRVLIKFSPRSRVPVPLSPTLRYPLPLVPHFFYHHAGDCTARIIKPVENAAGGLSRVAAAGRRGGPCVTRATYVTAFYPVIVSPESFRTRGHAVKLAVAPPRDVNSFAYR